MRRSPGHRTATARLSVQLDFQEHFDLNADDRDWLVKIVDASTWNPNVFLDAGHNFHSFPFGRTHGRHILVFTSLTC